MNRIICPICGVVNAVKESPWNDEGFASQDICPCCGTHYGEDDWAETKEERKQLFIKLRKEWIANGMKWKHDYVDDPFPENHPPKNWSPQQQLKNIPKEFMDRINSNNSEVIKLQGDTQAKSTDSNANNDLKKKKESVK